MSLYGLDDGVGYGVHGESRRGKLGVYGYSETGTGVVGRSKTRRGVVGFSERDVGVHGESSTSYGVYGYSDTSSGVSGLSNSCSGVYGYSGNSLGVYGYSDNAEGVIGRSSSTNGVAGLSYRGTGVYGFSYIGLAALLDGNVRITGGVDIRGPVTMTSDVTMTGPVSITGPLTKPAGSFKIDHPLDPANKYLSHSFVESPDMKNVYDGVVVLDDKGEADIELPDWFGALNKGFRYQLTAIGAPGPNLYISEEISDSVTNNNNRFKIAGGISGMKVSWQVTGIRKDPWANAHRIRVEEDKPAKERGYYTYPELFMVSQKGERGIISHLLFPREEEKRELLIYEQNK